MTKALKTEPDAPRIAHMPALRLVGLMRRYPATPEAMRKLGKQWQDLAHGLGGSLFADGPVLYGVHTGLFDTAEDQYFSGVETGAKDAIPPGLTELCLPAIPCAVIDHGGTAGEISQTTSKFLRDGTHRLAQSRPFDLIERYGGKFDPRTASGDIQLIIPVEA